MIDILLLGERISTNYLYCSNFFFFLFMLFSAETSTVAPKILIPITKITHQVLCILEACNAGAKNGQLYFYDEHLFIVGEEDFKESLATQCVSQIIMQILIPNQPIYRLKGRLHLHFLLFFFHILAQRAYVRQSSRSSAILIDFNTLFLFLYYIYE